MVFLNQKKDLKNTHELEPKVKAIFDKIHKKFHTFMNEKITGWDPCSILTHFADHKRDAYKFIKFEPTSGYIKFWAEDYKDNQRKWMWIPSEFEFIGYKNDKPVLKKNKVNQNYFNKEKYKVIWPKSGAYKNYRDTKILKPNEYFSDTFICAYFDSEEQCKNFISYFKTFLYRSCEIKTVTDHNAVRVVHSHCANLEKIKNPPYQCEGFWFFHWRWMTIYSIWSNKIWSKRK